MQHKTLHINQLYQLILSCKKTYPCTQENVINSVLITFPLHTGSSYLADKKCISCEESNNTLEKQLTMLK